MVNPRFSWTNEILGVKNGGKKWGPLFLSEYPRFWDSPEISGSRSRSYFCSVTLLYYFKVLEDVTEFETTPEGKKITKLEQILLNGNNITMLVPGGEGPEEA